MPTSGILKAQFRESGIGKLAGMRPRDVLADNLRALMKARPDRSRFPDIQAASKGSLTNGTLDRIRRAEVAITLDKLGDLADAFGLAPWQLLVEGLNPEALPQLLTSDALRQILDAVSSRDTTPVAQTLTIPPAHQVKPDVRPEVHPAVEKVLMSKGKRKNEVGQSGELQKPRTRRRA